jgi:putative FmdB family regulatory protein
MPAIYDYECKDCGNVQEFTGNITSGACVGCGGHNWVRRISAPQLVTRHASTVDYIIKRNRDKMKEVYEEDSSAESIKKMYQGM